MSPTSTGRFREESWLGRKGADTRDLTQEPEEEPNPLSASIRPTGFGGLLRSNTAGSGFPAPSSPWNSTPGATNVAPGGFGSFAMASGVSGVGDKRLAGSRGESRFAHLLSKDSSDNIAAKGNESAAPDLGGSWRSRQRIDTDPTGGEGQTVGGEGAFQYGTAAQHAHPFDTPVKSSSGDYGMAGLNLGAHDESSLGDTPETNPFRSPAGDQGEGDQRPIGGGSFAEASGSEQYQPLRGGILPTGLDAGDRSQTSSVGAKGFASVNPLGNWPSNFGINTPDRERPSFGNAFGSSLFAGEVHSPAFGTMPGGVFGSGPVAGMSGTGSIRGSKMNALFPSSMQTKAQTPDLEPLGDSVPDLRQSNPLGAIGRGSIGFSGRETDSPLRAGRPGLEELFDARSPTVFASADPTAVAFHAASTHTDIGPAQAKSMVMPDRMRWHYLDPQGEMQGPFTGLEMNDWYKANFFSTLR